MFHKHMSSFRRSALLLRLCTVTLSVLFFLQSNKMYLSVLLSLIIIYIKNNLAPKR